jgi:hypothetical protein
MNAASQKAIAPLFFTAAWFGAFAWMILHVG